VRHVATRCDDDPVRLRSAGASAERTECASAAQLALSRLIAMIATASNPHKADIVWRADKPAHDRWMWLCWQLLTWPCAEAK
jgi:hypothetical protein